MKPGPWRRYFWDSLFTPWSKNSGINLARLLAAVPFLIGMGLIVWVIDFYRVPRPNLLDDFRDFLDHIGTDGLKKLVFGLMLSLTGLVFLSTVRSLERARRAYARHLNRPADGESALSDRDSEDTHGIRLDAPDVSTPEKLFVVSRQRLLDEAIRLDSLSRRNLILGIMFSLIALLVLSWPLIAAAFQETHQVDVLAWATQYYLPRFAVGVLLQFVGFFFLRLYVSNELDLKHNKNEITNIEMRMIAAQLAQSAGDSAAKKDVIKSLAATERNFLLKKGERTISTEAVSEYNDMKGLLEKLANKFSAHKSD